MNVHDMRGEHHLRPGLMAAALTAGTVLIMASTATAHVEIPDGGAVQRDSTSVITFRVHDGCDGGTTDMFEVTIPESVENVEPQAVPGWVLTVETDEVMVEGTEDVDAATHVNKVRWSGGILPDGQFADFGLRAFFPDVEGDIAFPALQSCGLTEVRWDGDADSENPAPTVTVGPSVGPRDAVQLADDVAALSAEVASLKEELSGVDPANVRNRVADVEDRVSSIVNRLNDVEDRLPNFVERMSRLGDRIKALEDAQGPGQEEGAAQGN